MSTAARLPEVAPLGKNPPVLAFGDYLRVLGTVAVIAQHVAHRTTLSGTPDAGSATWWSLMSLEAACRWAVPLFVMLSGALLLDPKRSETPAEFYKKRFWRIGIPLLFWSLFYLLPPLAASGFSSAGFGNAATKLAHGRPAYHMYFLFVIAGLYFCTPYFRLLIQSLSPSALRQLWIAALAIASAAATVRIIYGYQVTVFSEFVPYAAYYLAGYNLRQSRLSPAGLWTAAAVIAIATASMVLVTTLFEVRYSITEGTRYLYDYFSPTVIAVSLCLFPIAATVFDRPRAGIVARWIASIAPTTLGIFLMHPALLIAIEQAQRHGLLRVWHWTVASTLLTTLFVFVVCWAATAMCQRIPIVKSVVG